MSEAGAAVLVVAGVILKNEGSEQKVLLVRRGPGQSGAGFWEFPGGKVESGESEEAALLRELKEELALEVRIKNFLGENIFQYSNKKICLRVYCAEILQGELILHEHDAFKWLSPAEIEVAELSEADRPFVALLLGK